MWVKSKITVTKGSIWYNRANGTFRIEKPTEMKKSLANRWQMRE